MAGKAAREDVHAAVHTHHHVISREAEIIRADRHRHRHLAVRRDDHASERCQPFPRPDVPCDADRILNIPEPMKKEQAC